MKAQINSIDFTLTHVSHRWEYITRGPLREDIVHRSLHVTLASAKSDFHSSVTGDKRVWRIMDPGGGKSEVLSSAAQDGRGCRKKKEA